MKPYLLLISFSFLVECLFAQKKFINCKLEKEYNYSFCGSSFQFKDSLLNFGSYPIKIGVYNSSFLSQNLCGLYFDNISHLNTFNIKDSLREKGSIIDFKFSENVLIVLTNNYIFNFDLISQKIISKKQRKLTENYGYFLLDSSRTIRFIDCNKFILENILIKKNDTIKVDHCFNQDSQSIFYIPNLNSILFEEYVTVSNPGKTNIRILVNLDKKEFKKSLLSTKYDEIIKKFKVLTFSKNKLFLGSKLNPNDFAVIDINSREVSFFSIDPTITKDIIYSNQTFKELPTLDDLTFDVKMAINPLDNRAYILFQTNKRKYLLYSLKM